MNLTNIIFVLLATLFSVSAKSDRIRLKDVETLTLYSDKWTTSRRSSPVKQLTCTGGHCNRATIETAQCYNRGFDGNDVQWECKAELPSNYKFGRLEVSCEGYEYPDDDYVLAGSCGLEYTISEVSKTSNSYFPSYSNTQSNAKDGYGSSMLTLVVVIGGAIALYFYLRPNNRRAQNNTGESSRFFNSNPSAPPPPGFRTDFSGTTVVILRLSLVRRQLDLRADRDFSVAWLPVVCLDICSDHRIVAAILDMVMVDVKIHSGIIHPHPDTHHLAVYLLVAAVEALEHQPRLHSHRLKGDKF